MVGILLKDEKKIFFLNKKFKFKNFLDSQNFINKVGEISENEGHHPDIFLVGLCRNKNYNTCNRRSYLKMILF
jgi:hypothetical protein